MWYIRAWLVSLRREDYSLSGDVLCESAFEPEDTSEILEILKISRYRELGISSKDLYLILKHIIKRLPFKEVELIKAPGKIFSVPGNNNYLEFTTNLAAARKCARHGYDVYMLPNPNEGKTPDFILVKNGKYYAYELKTIYSAASIWERMAKALGQSDRIMLDMVDTPSSRYIADRLKAFILNNPEVKDIMIFKGNKELHVTHQIVCVKSFVSDFMARWDR